MPLILGFMGLGGKTTSKGISDNVARLAANHGWTGKTYTHRARKEPAELIRKHQGERIILVGNSMGVNAIDDILEANPDIKVDVVFAVVSAWAEDFPQNAEHIKRITATRDRLRNFKITGRSVVTHEINESHLSADDSADLWRLVEREMLDMNQIAAIEASLERALDPSSETARRTAFYKAFFDNLRGNLYTTLSPETVDGLKGLLWLWDTTEYFKQFPDEYLAAILGNIYRETGGRMQPIRETNASTDEKAAAILDRWWASGEAQRFGVRSRYWARNSKGYPFGRGHIQTTHDENYVKTDKLIEQELGISTGLGTEYSIGMNFVVSAFSAFLGPIHGIYRGGRKLSDYLRGGEFDFYNSRDIINGDKGKVGREVERAGKAFLSAIQNGNQAASGIGEPVVTKPAPDPILSVSEQIILEEFNLLTPAAAQFILALRKYGSLPAEMESRVGNQITSNFKTKEPSMARKSIFKSKTFWGIAGTVATVFFPPAAPLIDVLSGTGGVVTDPEIAQQAQESIAGIVEAINKLITSATAAFAIYGRMVAEGPATLK